MQELSAELQKDGASRLGVLGFWGLGFRVLGFGVFGV